MSEVESTNSFIQATRELRNLKATARALGLSESAFTQALRDFSPDIRKQVRHGYGIISNLRLHQEGER